MPAYYFLPKTQIAFTEIPKTGCTTLKNYLVGLENEFGLGSAKTSSAVYLDMKIHSNQGAGRYRVSPGKFWRKKANRRVLVLRDPYRRAISAWANKLLYAQGDFSIFSKYKNEAFTPLNFSSLADLNQAFELFLTKLHEDPGFLASDRHWRPQFTFVNSLSRYDLVLETGNLFQLQGLLDAEPSLRHMAQSRPVPRFNATRPEMLRYLGTERVWQLIEKVYSRDFELLREAGLAVQSRPEIETITPAQERLFIEKESLVVEQSRRESELSTLRGSISMLRNSWSWRLTAPLRAFGQLLLR